MTRRTDGDSGASLVFMLVLLAFVGVVVGAVLKLTHTSLDATDVTSGEAREAFDVNGAMESAINQMRYSAFRNITGQQCPPLSFVGPNTGDAIAVACQGQAGTGGPGGPPMSSANKPSGAMMSFGNNTEIGITKLGSGVLPVAGSVKSNSTIRNSPTGTANVIQVTDGVGSARGNCTSYPNKVITATGGVTCNTGVALADPAYSPPAFDATYRSVPACPSGARAGKTIKFEPGFYDDAAALTSLMSSCTSSTFWFPAAADGTVGRYWFDFHNGESPFFPGSTTWTITDARVRLVGGTPKGWNPNASTREEPTVPGGCVAPTDSATNGGVEFIFGGRSQLLVTAGRLEICGQYRANEPPIAVRGASANIGPTMTGPSPSWGTGFESVPGCADFNNHPEDAQYADAKSAERNLNQPKERACMRVAGFSQLNIPQGSLVVSAMLAISHAEEKTPAGIEAVVTPNPGSGGSPLSTQNVTPIVPQSGKKPVPGWFKADITQALSEEIRVRGLADAQMDYTVRKADNATPTRVLLDTVQLVVTWLPPGVRAENTPITGYTSSGTHTVTGVVRTGPAAGDTTTLSYSATGSAIAPANCVSATPYNGSGTVRCAMLKTALAAPSAFYVQGTGYTPLAAIDLSQTGLTEPVFDVGLLGRALRVNLAAAAGFTGPRIVIFADQAGPRPVGVHFHAYLCAAGEDCGGVVAPSPPWRLAGGARVTFSDPSGAVVPGSRDVLINDWELYF